jgi:adenylate cyclase
VDEGAPSPMGALGTRARFFVATRPPSGDTPRVKSPSPDSLAQLVEAVADLGAVLPKLDPEGGSPALAADLRKFSVETGLLSAEVSALVAEAGGEEALRRYRHDGRNRLNHLFGLVQLIRIGAPPPALVAAVDEAATALERCLAGLASAPSPSEEREGELDAPAPSDDAPSDSLLALTDGDGPEETGTLLVADDDPENCEILRRLLEPRGFRLEFAENGVEAIEKLERGDYDAVLLDIRMPLMDGFEVLSRLREGGRLGNTPVIVVTGLQEEQDAVRCIEKGAEDFLSRPIRPALLMARLRASLEKKRLRERVFEQHFTRELARELARNPDPMKMQARQAEVTVMFCDIRGFSAVSERLGPAQTVAWLGGVMGEFSSVVIDHGGVLVDYTGDELLAMWGAPNEQPDHAELACRAALEIRARLPELDREWKSVVGVATEVGIGISSGEALVGNIGTHRKFKYGPLGTVVNLASRVQGATKPFRTSMLLTGATAEKVPGLFPTRRLARVRARNIAAPVDLLEPGPPDDGAQWEGLARLYEEALAAFERAELDRAEALLSDFLGKSPGDGAAELLSRRLAEARSGKSFDPVWDLPSG